MAARGAAAAAGEAMRLELEDAEVTVVRMAVLSLMLELRVGLQRGPYSAAQAERLRLCEAVLARMKEDGR